MVIELDAGTAAIPWELLDTPNRRSARRLRPWAIRTHAAQAAHRRVPRPVSDADADGSVLVIGEPLVDETIYPPLPGARAEALAVGAIRGVDAAASAGDTIAVINALFERPRRILHVAGHGGRRTRAASCFATPSSARPRCEAMRTVPELVFLNCCLLHPPDATRDRARRCPLTNAPTSPPTSPSR